MNYGILAANLKNYIDITESAEDLSPEKSIFQLSIGGKKDKIGWHYIVREGTCQLKRGLFTGEIFIDWNDEFKYKEKSKKHIKQETTPDYEVNFKDGKDFESFVEECGRFVSGKSTKRPKVKGSKLSGSKCDTAEFDETLVWALGLQTPYALELEDQELLGYASRMALCSLAEAFSLMLKDGDPDVSEFAKGSRKSYFFDDSQAKRSVWVTAQNGLIKVTSNQGTRLAALCGLEFEDDRAVLSYIYGKDKEAGYEKAYLFSGASTYGNDVDREIISRQFHDCCIKAAIYAGC